MVRDIVRHSEFKYIVKFGSYIEGGNKLKPAYVVGWYLDAIGYAGITVPLYDVDGEAAIFPKRDTDTREDAEGLKFEIIGSIYDTLELLKG